MTHAVTRLLVFLCTLLFAVPAAARVRIITTTEDLAAIASAVGGDFVQVESIARGTQDPHYVAAKPSYMRKLNRADLLVYNGLELEIGWLPLLIEGARNPAVVPGAKGHLNASAGIRVLEVPAGAIDRSMGDVHPEGNPHYTLDPRNGLVVAGAIAERLAEIDPGNADGYADLAEAFRENLSRRISGWEDRARALRGRTVVTHHKQFEYFADWLGLTIADYVEVKPGVPPSPRHVNALINRIRDERIPVILTADFIDPRAANQIAERAGAVSLVLPVSVGGADGLDTYPSLFDHLITALHAAIPD